MALRIGAKLGRESGWILGKSECELGNTGTYAPVDNNKTVTTARKHFLDE
jgi:hypothetical protein